MKGWVIALDAHPSASHVCSCSAYFMRERRKKEDTYLLLPACFGIGWLHMVDIRACWKFEEVIIPQQHSLCLVTRIPDCPSLLHKYANFGK